VAVDSPPSFAPRPLYDFSSRPDRIKIHLTPHQVDSLSQGSSAFAVEEFFEAVETFSCDSWEKGATFLLGSFFHSNSSIHSGTFSNIRSFAFCFLGHGSHRENYFHIQNPTRKDIWSDPEFQRRCRAFDVPVEPFRGRIPRKKPTGAEMSGRPIPMNPRWSAPTYLPRVRSKPALDPIKVEKITPVELDMKKFDVPKLGNVINSFHEILDWHMFEECNVSPRLLPSRRDDVSQQRLKVVEVPNMQSSIFGEEELLFFLEQPQQNQCEHSIVSEMEQFSAVTRSNEQDAHPVPAEVIDAPLMMVERYFPPESLLKHTRNFSSDISNEQESQFVHAEVVEATMGMEERNFPTEPPLQQTDDSTSDISNEQESQLVPSEMVEAPVVMEERYLPTESPLQDSDGSSSDSSTEEDDDGMHWESSSASSEIIAPGSPALGERLYEECISPATPRGFSQQPDWSAASRHCFAPQPQPQQSFCVSWNTHMPAVESFGEGFTFGSFAETQQPSVFSQNASYDPFDASTSPADIPQSRHFEETNKATIFSGDSSFDPFDASTSPDDIPDITVPGGNSDSEEEEEEMDQDEDEKPLTDWQRLVRPKQRAKAIKTRQASQPVRVVFRAPAPASMVPKEVSFKPATPYARVGAFQSPKIPTVSAPKKLVVKFSANQSKTTLSAAGQPFEAPEATFDIFNGTSASSQYDMDPFAAGAAAQMMATVSGQEYNDGSFSGPEDDFSDESDDEEELGSDDDIDDDILGGVNVADDELGAMWNNYVASGGR
jgi:hypothetical protein